MIFFSKKERDIMTRQARKISSTGIYHVLLRGINRQRIFEEAEDYGSAD